MPGADDGTGRLCGLSVVKQRTTDDVCLVQMTKMDRWIRRLTCLQVKFLIN